MATKKASPKVTNQFLALQLANVNKTEQDVVTEKVTAFLEEAAIDCEMQIAERTTGAIPRKELELKTAKQGLTKAEKALEVAKVSVPSDGELSTYLRVLYNAESAVKSATNQVANVENEIAELKKEVAKLNEVLARFKA